MKRKLIFLVLAILLLAPWPVAYAYGDNTGGSQNPVQIETAPSLSTPSWNAYGHAIGGVVPGDLFYIDATDNPADVRYTLDFTNTDELIHYYRYLTLKVGVYVQTGAGWEKAITGNGALLPDTYITLLNGSVSFTAPGCGKYKITIDRGCFYSYGNGSGEGNASPAFYLTVE